MEKELLNLTPKRFLCPYCGEWHPWKQSHELGYYDSCRCQAAHVCADAPSGTNKGNYKIYFVNGYCYYTTEPMCNRAKLNLDGIVAISSIVESFDKPIVTFKVPFRSDEEVGSRICKTCPSMYMCNLVKLGDAGDHRNMEITLGFEFEQSDYEKFAKTAILARKERELQERESALRSKQQEFEQQQRAEQPAKQEIKEESTMANNIFNMHMEFGTNKDENIASTLMGVAVKNGDSWRIYDKKKKEITDVGDMQLGNLPIFILPTTKLNEGDLIKDAGEYYFVMKVAEGSTQTLCAKTGEMKNVIPIKNVLGFSCYSKVIALSDSINMGDDFDVEKLAIMSAMCGQNGEDGGQMNQLLPLMLFKDKLGGDDDMMKMLLMTSMMSAPAEGGDQNATMNQLLPLMLLKEKDGGDDDMMKMVLMSSMMGGNMAGNNPVMGYLMLDMLMGKKKGEQPLQQSGE